MPKILFYLLLFVLISCSSKQVVMPKFTIVEANRIAQKYIIVDGHVDLPYRLRVKNFRLEKEFLGIPYSTKDGDFDFLRSRQGGLDAPFMSIYIPASYQREGGAKELADSLIDMVSYIANNQKQFFEIAYNPNDVRRVKASKRIALPMGMENGAPVENDINLVAYFKKKGISYITLTHSKDNKICDSSYDTTRTWKGLSPYGYDVIKAMEKSGVMIDISHVSDSSFYQVLRTTKLPVIASHSSCRKFTPGFERNMSDDMIVRMRSNGGVIMVNFGSTFLDGRVDKYNDSIRAVMYEELAQKGIDKDSEKGKEFIKTFSVKHPKLYSDVKKVVDHIDHIVKLCGVECVGFGSDYDGVGDSLPTGLKDVSTYPNLILELLNRGYTEQQIGLMCGENLLRVWQKVIDHSEQ